MSDDAALVAFVTDQLNKAQEPVELAVKYKSSQSLWDGPLEEVDFEESERLQETWGDAPHTAHCGYRLYEFSEACVCGMPATVLADVAAKRRIVADYVEAIRLNAEAEADGGSLGRAMEKVRLFTAKRSVLHLVSVWCEHPDYDPAWTVE